MYTIGWNAMSSKPSDFKAFARFVLSNSQYKEWHKTHYGNKVEEYGSESGAKKRLDQLLTIRKEERSSSLVERVEETIRSLQTKIENGGLTLFALQLEFLYNTENQRVREDAEAFAATKEKKTN